MIREQYEQIMRQGAILVDDTDAGDALTAIFVLEHSIQDGRMISVGKPHVISQRLQFAAIDKPLDWNTQRMIFGFADTV